MAKKINMSIKIQIVIGLVLFVILMSFVQHKQGSKEIKKLDIRIKDLDKTHFVSSDDIREILIHKFQSKITGELVENVNVKDVEKLVENDKFVESAQVYRDLDGGLVVELTQRKPVGRFISRDSSFYIGQDGHSIPLSKRYAARVCLVSGFYEKNYIKDSVNGNADTSFVKVLNYIDKDVFFKKQIAQIDVKKNGELILMSQMSGQQILFGEPVNVEDKFKRLKLFYKKILLAKGYNAYGKVNVTFKKQIVCE